MFKKLTAVTLAAVMLLMPMTASAVTWGALVDALTEKSYYDDGETSACIDYDILWVQEGKITGEVDLNYEGFLADIKTFMFESDIDADSFYIGCYGGDRYVSFWNGAEVKIKDVLGMNVSGNLSIRNNTDIVMGEEGYVYIDAFENAGVTIGGEGSIQYDMPANLFMNVPEGELPSAEEIEKFFANYDEEQFTGGTYKTVWTYTVDEEGYIDYTALYRLNENGELELIDELVHPSAPKFPKPSPEELRRREMERKRQKEAIGGVSASPYWVKQLFLGYRSLNLRLYIGGEQVNFRERLGWLVEEGAKRLNLRVNTENPENVTMRFDEEVLDILDRAEISTLVLQDKSSDAIMTYRVSDLRAAYEKYGLNGTDLLVVGGENDDVMKIGADGQMVPVEQETEAPAA